jgi:hypothetical protein
VPGLTGVSATELERRSLIAPWLEKRKLTAIFRRKRSVYGIGDRYVGAYLDVVYRVDCRCAQKLVMPRSRSRRDSRNHAARDSWRAGGGFVGRLLGLYDWPKRRVYHIHTQRSRCWPSYRLVMGGATRFDRADFATASRLLALCAARRPSPRRRMGGERRVKWAPCSGTIRYEQAPNGGRLPLNAVDYAALLEYVRGADRSGR